MTLDEIQLPYPIEKDDPPSLKLWKALAPTDGVYPVFNLARIKALTAIKEDGKVVVEGLGENFVLDYLGKMVFKTPDGYTLCHLHHHWLWQTFPKERPWAALVEAHGRPVDTNC